MLLTTRGRVEGGGLNTHPIKKILLVDKNDFLNKCLKVILVPLSYFPL